MAKFKIGDKLKTNEYYNSEYQRIFNKKPKNKGGIVLDIQEYEDGNVIYFFTNPDFQGNRQGLSEKFVELR